jgi:hypothetical protein
LTIGTGLKKCKPPNWCGRLVTAAISEIRIDEVLEAKTVLGRAICGVEILSCEREVYEILTTYGIDCSKQRMLRLNIFDDRLDHQISAGNSGSQVHRPFDPTKRTSDILTALDRVFLELLPSDPLQRNFQTGQPLANPLFGQID